MDCPKKGVFMQQKTFCSDQELVELYFARTERAIAETQRKYDKLCKYISQNILADEQDAEECVSDAYIALWNSIPPQKPDSVKLFLAKIVRRVSINRLEYNRARKRDCKMTVSFEEMTQECVALGADLDVHAEQMEVAEAINVFLAQLPLPKRNVLVLRFWMGASIADIAKRLGMNENTVKTTLRREQQRLRKYLEERGVLA